MTPIGVIILGNSRVGKSFLGNMILGHQAFEDRVRATAVTIVTEFKLHSIAGQKYAVYNIPGLVEARQDRIDLNKREIDRAFIEHPYGVVLFVFGCGDGGGIRSEDLIAFNAINDAYPLSEKSLIIIINNIPEMPENERSEYVSETKMLLKESLGLKNDIEHICFIDKIDKSSTTEKEAVQKQLIDKITTALPKKHKKEHDIHLQAADLSKLRAEMNELVKQIQEERKKHRLELERQATAIRDMERLRIRDSKPIVVEKI